MDKPKVKILRLDSRANLPVYKSKEAAGADICACLSDDIVIQPHEFLLVPTGFAMSLPEGYEAQIRPRSGLAAKYGITVLNSPGTIDSDYRGEVKIILINHSDKPYTISNGERIAQMIIASHCKATFTEIDILDSTDRKTGGFGSTGK